MAQAVRSHFHSRHENKKCSTIFSSILGGDDRRVLLWNLERCIFEEGKPVVMLKQHLSNIFCLSFDSKNTRIFSGGNDDMAIVHDIET